MTNQPLGKAVRKLKPIDLPPLSKKPLVSVVTANYNYGRYIGDAIESALEQTYQNLEMIICDDGSTDGSREVIARYAEQDPRVKFIAKENGGIASALNAAYAASQGEILCLLDADDVFLSGKLERVVRAFQTSPRSGVCLHRIRKMYSDGRTFGCPVPVVFAEGWVGPEALQGGGFARNLPSRMNPTASGMSFRRSVTEELFPIPRNLRRMVDAYLCDAAQFFTEICAVRCVLAKLRIHTDNVSSAGEYTLDSIGRNMADLELLLSMIQAFLSNRYGREMGREMKREDNSLYCNFLVMEHILADKRVWPESDRSLVEIVRRIEPRRERLLARVLLALPPTVARAALRLWMGRSPAEAMVIRFARFLLRV